ncbi:putative uncharacterized protein DDB_G0290521 [Culicoides brevitarsis]|uniref:putative uncharacterized protein DDB_G0290521 n=1 Tax=Culicoides brevitarsis TaxID=469753 RepID=UPI00307BFBF5
MTTAKEKLVVLSGTDTERIKEAEKRLKKVEAEADKGQTSSVIESPSQIPSFKITNVKTLTSDALPTSDHPRKVRYKTLPNGQRIKIVPKSRKAVTNRPIREPPPRPSMRGGIASRGRVPPNRTINAPINVPASRASLGGAIPPNRPPLSSVRVPPSRTSLGNVRTLQAVNAPSRQNPQLRSVPGVLPLKIAQKPTVQPTPSTNPIVMKPIQIPTPPQRASPTPEPPISTTISTTKIVMKEKIDATPPPVTTEAPSTSSSSGERNKRKSQHVTKPIEDMEFEESVVVEGNLNTDLMSYVACLRVALNNLLEEVDLKPLNFPGGIGKVKISEQVEKLLKPQTEKEENEKKIAEKSDKNEEKTVKE